MIAEGRVALVTAAGSGIGRATARKLAELGAKVVINDIDGDKTNETVRDIAAAGGEAVGIVADVSRKEAVGRLFDEALSRFGKLDILVNNAGIGIDGTIEEATEEDWDRVIAVSLKSAFLCSQLAARAFIRQKYGRIVNIASRMWLGGVGQASYSAAKGGVVSLTRTCAIELIAHNVTVNCVAPGQIATPPFYALPSGRQEEILQRLFVPGRIGKPEEVAGAVAFFASEDAGFVTGQILHVCGGKSLGARW